MCIVFIFNLKLNVSALGVNLFSCQLCGVLYSVSVNCSVTGKGARAADFEYICCNAFGRLSPLYCFFCENRPSRGSN